MEGLWGWGGWEADPPRRPACVTGRGLHHSLEQRLCYSIEGKGNSENWGDPVSYGGLGLCILPSHQTGSRGPAGCKTLGGPERTRLHPDVPVPSTHPGFAASGELGVTGSPPPLHSLQCWAMNPGLD